MPGSPVLTVVSAPVRRRRRGHEILDLAVLMTMRSRASFASILALASGVLSKGTLIKLAVNKRRENAGSLEPHGNPSTLRVPDNLGN
jgi:hypothetical protein